MKKRIWSLITTIIIGLILAVPGPAVRGAMEEYPISSLLGSGNTTGAGPVQYLTDGKTETAWETTASAPGWVELGLAEPVFIDGLRFYGIPKGSLWVEYWRDGGWHSFLAAQNLPGELFQSGWNLLDLSYDRITAGRLRLRLDNDGSPKLGGIGELKVLGRRVGDQLQRLDPVSVTASDRFGWDHRQRRETCPGDYLFDHNTYTGWELREGRPFETAEAVASLGENSRISRIKFYSGQPAGSSKGWFKKTVRLKIQYQKNGNWIDFPGLGNLDLGKIGAETGAGWRSFEFTNQNISAAKIRIQLGGEGRAGILKEVEIWGQRGAGLGSRYLYGGFGPVGLSETVAANYEFSLTPPVKGIINLHLVGSGNPATKLAWELNGRSMGELTPAGVANGAVFYRQTIAPETLWEGANFIRVRGNGFTIRDCRLEIAPDSGLNITGSVGLNDGWLLTPAVGETIDLEGRCHLDEVFLHYLGNSPPASVQLAVEENGEWTGLTPTRLETGPAGGTFIFTPARVVRRIRVGNPGVTEGLTELSLHGSRINEGPPRVKILAPQDGEVLNLTEWIQQKLVGTVDNPEAEIRINGFRADTEGTIFEIPLSRLGLKSNETKTVEVVATDPAGRTGTDKITISIGLPPNFTVNLPDRVVYTKDAQITVSGQVQVSSCRVFINGVEAPVKNKAYTLDLPLQEGFNPIAIKVSLGGGHGFDFSNMKLRRVVRSSTPPYLKVSYPADGMMTREGTIAVSGTVGSLQPVQVTVNGQAVPVVSGSFTSGPITLAEGDNPITVIAADQTGLASQAKLTVKRDRTPPELTVTTPAEAANLNATTIRVSGTVKEAAPVSVLVNGWAASILNGQFTVDISVNEGWNDLKIDAYDAAGNSRSVTRGVFIDTKPPAEFTPTADISGWSNNNRPAITFETTDGESGIDHYEIRLDTGSWLTPAVSPWRFDGALPDGEHTVSVKAVDRAGNERAAEVKVYIDTTPPGIPANFRVIPGNGRIVVKWDEDSADVVEYRIERDPAPGSAITQTTGKEFIDPGLENGVTYKYRVWAIDHAQNQSEPTGWQEAMVGLAVAEYAPNEGTIVEYDGVTLMMPKVGLPEGITRIEVTEVTSQHLEEKAVYPILGPVYEFSAYKAGENAPLENCTMEEGYLGSIQYNPDLVPEGFPEQNLGVYYYEPMFDRWFLVDVAGVDPKNHTIYFLTNHFSSFSVQVSLIQDLSPQEYKDSGYSPLKSYSEHDGVMVSPQGGTASTRVTELVLPGRDGFDLVLSRRYDTATARNDAFSLAINGRLGMNLTAPAGADGFKLLKDLNEIRETVHTLEDAGDFIEDNIRNILEQYLFSQGDFAYSMGQGWRLNLPYIKAANKALMLCDANGAVHSINEMNIVGVPVSLPNYRKVTFKQQEGDDFTLTVEQVSAPLDILGLISGDEKKIFKSRWYSAGYELRLKDGTTYKMDALGRTTGITDPNGKNTIDLSYDGLLLDHITDTMGRRVRFGYQTTLLWPRINKIWVENDSYHREISYSISGGALLDSARDAGGRMAYYDYDTRLLVAGEAGFTVNILTILVKLVGGPIAGLAGSIFGADDIEIFGRFQAQLVYPMKAAAAPGQGKITIEYNQPTFIYGNVSINYFKLLIVDIPISVTFSINMEQRLLADKVNVYLYSGGPLVKSTGFSYEFNTGTHGQPYVTKTVENDGNKKIVYHYQSFAKERHRWEDRSVPIGEYPEGTTAPFQLWFPLSVYSVHMVTVNKSTEIRDAQTGALLESNETEYDSNTLRPTVLTTRRGANYRRLTYSYDDWGNTTYTWDYSTSGARVNQTKTWIYYLGVSSPSSEAPWLGSPYSEPVRIRPRRNLPVGKVVANYVPVKGGGQNITYLHSYNQYNETGQLTGSAQWDGTKWLFTEYEYHPTYGSLVKRTNPEGHETVYEYDQHGLPAAVIEKAVTDAKGVATDIVTRTGYEYISGWKLWQQNPRGFVTEYVYDSLGRTTKIIAPDDDPGEKGWIPSGGAPSFRLNNPVTEIHYNDVDLSSEVTDALGNRTRYDFDNLGRMIQLLKYQRADGQYSPAAITDLQYDSWGNITAITDPNRHTTRYEYDALGRNTAIIYPEYQGKTPRRSMSFDYDSNLLTVTDENGNISHEHQDMQGRTYKQVKYNDSETIITERYFDGLGNEVITIDPKGSTTVKIYNPLNLLARVDLPSETFRENGREETVSPYRRYEYNQAGFKTYEYFDTAGGEQYVKTDPDALGRVIRTTMPYTDNGEAKLAVSEVYYDPNGNKVRVVDANNTLLPDMEQKAFVYTYSAVDLVTSETDPAGNMTSYTYDAVGNRKSMTDPRGNSGKYTGDFTIIYHYDDLNRLVEGYLPKSPRETTKPLVQLRYDARGNLERRIEPDGGMTVYTYTGRNWVETETARGDGGSYTTTHRYDLAGNETEVVDARGYSTKKEYDGLNRLVEITYPEGNSEWFEYDVNNNRTGYINGKSIKTGYSYDRYNHLKQVTDALGGATVYSYDRFGNLTLMENALGHRTGYQYDELNRLFQETDPQGYVQQYRYDAVGNRIWSKDPNGTESVYEYYPNNLVKKVILSNGSKNQVTEYQYDESGYRKRIQSDGVITEYNTDINGYMPDPFGRIRRESKTIDGQTFTVGYNYDVMGRVTKITYPTGQAVDYQYNNLGQLVKVPGYVNEKPVYDNGGLLKSLKAINGITTAWDYDRNGRLTKLGYNSQAIVLKEYTFGYDQANNIIQKNQDVFQYDLLNQLLYANLKGDFEINPDEEVQKVGKVRDDYNKQNPLEFAVQEPDIIEMDYAAGSIGVDLLAPVKVTRVELKPNSPIHRVSAGTIRVYTSQDNLAYTKVDGWKSEKRDKGGFAIILDTPVTARYIKIKSLYDDRDEEYNPVNKSTFVNVPNDLIMVYYLLGTRLEEYTYDKIGNRKTETVTQRNAVARTYTYYPNSSRLKSNGKYSFEYDPNGNLVKKETIVGKKVVWGYGYDLLNRLVRVTKDEQVVAEYVYDEAGLRVKKEGTESDIYYMFDVGGNVLYEQENRRYLEYVYVLGKHFARIDGNLDKGIEKKYFYHTDHLGSTVLVTDEAGKQVWSAEYTPFGKQVSKEGELEHVSKFTGKDLDEDAGLYYFNARWYDQEIGRFVTQDDISIVPNDPATLNFYSYVKNNPLGFTDPTGHFWQEFKNYFTTNYGWRNDKQVTEYKEQIEQAEKDIPGFKYNHNDNLRLESQI